MASLRFFVVFLLVGLTAVSLVEPRFVDSDFYKEIGITNQRQGLEGDIHINYVWVAYHWNVTYVQAAKRCPTTGLHLLQIYTKEMLEYLNWWFEGRNEQMWELWTSTRFDETEGMYTWGNGSEIMSSLWAPGEPSQNSSETLITTVWRRGKMYLRVDKNPEARKRFICFG